MKELMFNIFANDFITAKNLPETNYDYYIVGSDQIWNPYHGKLRDLDLLYCIEPSKRISYAASIGIDEIPNDSISFTLQFSSKIISLLTLNIWQVCVRQICLNQWLSIGVMTIKVQYIKKLCIRTQRTSFRSI